MNGREKNERTERIHGKIFAGIIAIIGCLSLLTQVRIQSSLFPATRERQLRALIDWTRANRTVNLPLFWQTRDQFGNGFFTLNPDHTMYHESQNIDLIAKNGVQEIATYHSKRVEAHDYLYPNLGRENTSTILDRITERSVPSSRLIYQDDYTRMYFTDANTLTLAFVTSMDQIATVNGVFGFSSDDLKTIGPALYASTTSFTMDCCSTFATTYPEAFIDKK